MLALGILARQRVEAVEDEPDRRMVHVADQTPRIAVIELCRPHASAS